MYSSSLIPGLLQTEGYALAVLQLAVVVHDLPHDDIAEAAHSRAGVADVHQRITYRCQPVRAEPVVGTRQNYEGRCVRQTVQLAAEVGGDLIGIAGQSDGLHQNRSRGEHVTVVPSSVSRVGPSPLARGAGSSAI